MGTNVDRTARHVLEGVFREAVGSIDLSARVARALRRLDPPLPRRAILVAAGKSAPAMAAGALEVIEPAAPPLVVTVAGTPVALPVEQRIAGHPVPDEASVAAAEDALALARSASARVPFVFLVSGGASALLCAPRRGLSLAGKRRLVRALVVSGLPIEEINARRGALSRIKDGRLAAASPRGARVVTLVASDVLADDDLAVVGSGPTTGWHAPRVEAVRVAGPEDLARAAARAARRVGLEVRRLPIASGPVQALAERYGAVEAPGLHVAVGEPTIVVPRGAGGVGGRSQHLAMLVARAIEGRRVAFLAAGSDGIDGATSAAGAVIDGSTWRAARRRGGAAALAAFDSGGLAARLGASVVTGPTGLNLLDLHLLWVIR